MALTANAAFTERHMLVSLALADPALGDPIIYPVPANTVIQVVGVRLEFRAGPFVIDRRVCVFAYQNFVTGDIQASPAPIVQTAGLAWVYDFSCGIGPVDASGDATPVVSAPLACGLQLQAGEELHIVALGMQVLDAFANAVIRFYRWKED